MNVDLDAALRLASTSIDDPGSQFAKLLPYHLSQLGQLTKEGKISQQEFLRTLPPQLQEYIKECGVESCNANPRPARTPPGLKASSLGPMFTSEVPGLHAISPSLNVTITNLKPVPWNAAAQQGRPTLTGGIPGGRILGA
ncbi:hypothetical protein HWV62_16182 [Athelia sp. TMB]|nr:hypothetical protein HWV62_16182 [Athelia sp. TMB]